MVDHIVGNVEAFVNYVDYLSSHGSSHGSVVGWVRGPMIGSHQHGGLTHMPIFIEVHTIGGHCLTIQILEGLEAGRAS